MSALPTGSGGADLAAGFDRPVHDAQASFRALLGAMSRPGRIVPLDLDLTPPAPLAVAGAATLLTLVDFDTPVWLDPAAATAPVVDYLRFHCGCRTVADPAAAGFALVAAPAAMPPLDAFAQGSDDYPDRSTTLVLQLEELADDGAWSLTGPGIDGAARLHAAPLPGDFLAQLRANQAGYPRGVDLVLACGARLAALPRSTRVEG